jgi:hypothetical protein
MQAPHAVLRAQGWYYRRALRWTEGQSATEAVHLCSHHTISCGLGTLLAQHRPYTPGPVCSEKSRVGQIYRSDVRSAYRRPVQHRCRARSARRRRPVLQSCEPEPGPAGSWLRRRSAGAAARRPRAPAPGGYARIARVAAATVAAVQPTSTVVPWDQAASFWTTHARGPAAAARQTASAVADPSKSTSHGADRRAAFPWLSEPYHVPCVTVWAVYHSSTRCDPSVATQSMPMAPTHGRSSRVRRGEPGDGD